MTKVTVEDVREEATRVWGKEAEVSWEEGRLDVYDSSDSDNCLMVSGFKRGQAYAAARSALQHLPTAKNGG